jgi:hypothetical protein
VEAALQAVCNFCDIGNVGILGILVVVLGEFEVDFLGEVEFQKEVHYLCVFLLVEVVVGEHGDAPAYDQLAA